jgi:hypothetical protein
LPDPPLSVLSPLLPVIEFARLLPVPLTAAFPMSSRRPPGMSKRVIVVFHPPRTRRLKSAGRKSPETALGGLAQQHEFPYHHAYAL